MSGRTRVLAQLVLSAAVGLDVQAQSASQSPADTAVPLYAVLAAQGYIAISLRPVLPFLNTDITVGTTTFSGLIDCGFSGALAIDRTAAHAIHMHGFPYRRDVGAGTAMGALSDTGHIQRLQLGTFAIGPARVMISKGVGDIGDAVGSQGLIGAQLLSQYRGILDYENQTLYVDSTTSVATPVSSHSISGLYRPGDVRVPLRRIIYGPSHSVMYIVRARIAGKSVNLLIDTGAQTSIAIDDRRATSLDLKATSTGLQKTGVTGAFEVRTGILPQIQMGAFQRDSAPFETIDLTNVRTRQRADGAPPIDGIVGADVLWELGAVIDFGHDTLYVRQRR